MPHFHKPDLLIPSPNRVLLWSWAVRYKPWAVRCVLLYHEVVFKVIMGSKYWYIIINKYFNIVSLSLEKFFLGEETSVLLLWHLWFWHLIDLCLYSFQCWVQIVHIHNYHVHCIQGQIIVMYTRQFINDSGDWIWCLLYRYCQCKLFK